MLNLLGPRPTSWTSFRSLGSVLIMTFLLIVITLQNSFANNNECGFSPGGCRCRIQKEYKSPKALYDITFGEVILREQKTFTYDNTIDALRACKEEVSRMDVCR